MLRRGPSRRLKTFLTREDLDDLLTARMELGEVGERDRKAIEAVLEDWSEHQAVSNLLFYPDLIPEGIRMPCVLRALDQEGDALLPVGGDRRPADRSAHVRT